MKQDAVPRCPVCGSDRVITWKVLVPWRLRYPQGFDPERSKHREGENHGPGDRSEEMAGE